MPEPEMPAKDGSGITGTKKYLAGSARSQERLKQLKHDPILKQVKLYWELEAEVRRLKEIRDGHVQKMVVDATGKPVVYRYSSEMHTRLLEQMQKINEGLMRYGYGRVPELQNPVPDSIPELVINLSQNSAGVYEPKAKEEDVSRPAPRPE